MPYHAYLNSEYLENVSIKFISYFSQSFLPNTKIYYDNLNVAKFERYFYV